MKLNGWQRIGVVCSFLWVFFISICILMDYQWVNRDRSHIGRYLETGMSEYCSNVFIERYRAENPEQFNEEWNKRCAHESLIVVKIHSEKIFIDTLVPIFSLWLMTFLAVFLIKWIVEGFRQKS